MKKYFSLIIMLNLPINSYSQNLDSLYKVHDGELNLIYRNIQAILFNEEYEKKRLKLEQVDWLKTRNYDCSYNGRSKPTVLQMACLDKYNLKRTSYLKINYLGEGKFNKNLFLPVEVKNNKKVNSFAINCMCAFNSIMIEKNSLIFRNSCDMNQSYKSFHILNKENIENYGIKFEIDSNSNGVADFSISFVSVGYNIWNIIFNIKTKGVIDIQNFSKKYILENNYNIVEECGDFDG